MNHYEFEQFVQDNGKDVLRFCRMTCGDIDAGDELYQDTMLTLLGKRQRLRSQQNVKSYALSISILLWKNKKKKYANRHRLMPMESLDGMKAEGNLEIADTSVISPESCALKDDEKRIVQQAVANLSEKYRMPIHLYYSADMSTQEISEILHIPVGTVKSRINKAKQLLKKELEALGYDR